MIHWLGGDKRHMSNISDLIEKYLKDLLEQSKQDQIEIQRNELAGKFDCVPSQINYVLTTRFNLERGFMVESRRGGGGYIRIVRLPLDKKTDLVTEINQLIGNQISQRMAEGIIRRLVEEKLINTREGRLMLAATSREVLRVGLPARDQLRALIMKAMINTILRAE